MRRKGTVILLFIALVLALVSLFGGNTFARLRLLRGSLVTQREKNEELTQYVDGIKSEVRRLKTDDRTLEKAARNNLGMARPNEVIFFFDEKKEDTK